MGTLTALITYTGCKISGDISVIGTSTYDTGYGKVMIGEGTTFAAESADLVKPYDKSALETFDGTASGIYLAEGTVLEKTENGFKVIKITK